jgi:hypothetical protein
VADTPDAPPLPTAPPLTSDDLLDFHLRLRDAADVVAEALRRDDDRQST